MPIYEESSSGGDAASDDSLELIEYYQVAFMDFACIFSVLLDPKIHLSVPCPVMDAVGIYCEDASH